ncbi:hypothetical protein BJV77DRAFT_1074974 [Russula vinacea]|nr:hypothetical protein BJV77DRAFT_1074974 [Russula vinacea]
MASLRPGIVLPCVPDAPAWAQLIENNFTDDIGWAQQPFGECPQCPLGQALFFAGASDALEWARGIISDDGCCKAFVQFLSLLLWFINTGLCVLIGLSLNLEDVPLGLVGDPC